MNEKIPRNIAWGSVLLAPLGAWGQSLPVESPDVPEGTESVGMESPLLSGVSGEAKRPIGARQAVQLALRNSPALSAASIESKRSTYSVMGEEGRFQFIFQADAGYTESTTPRLQQNDQVSSNTSRNFVVGAQLSRAFAVGTTSVLRIQGERFENSFSGFINPLLNQAGGFGTTARFTLTQPLLRGFGTTVGEVELRAARATRTQAEKTERRVTSQLVRDVLTAYWELWYASEAVAIEEKALELAVAQERDAQARVARGALAPADALTFSTRVAELEESVVTAQANEKAQALELLRLTGTGDRPEGSEDWRAEAPPEGLATPSRAELEKAMLSDSIELAELEAQVETARVRAEVAGDELRPRLDVDGYVETRGLGAEPSSALGRATEFGWVAGHVGLTFELPTDDSRKNAARQSALLAVSAAQANLKATRDKLKADAARGLTRVQAAEKRLVLAQKTRELAQKTYDAARGRYELGLSIPIQVLEADDNVRRAKLREARARVDLATEQTLLQHVSGALIDQYGG